MKKTNNNYLLFGLVGLAVVGTVAVLYQKSGQRFQKDLIIAVKKTAVATKKTLNALID